MTQFHSIKAFGLICALFVLVSCGSQKPMVTQVKVDTSVIDQDVWISLSADLSIGNLLLPNAVIPILIPKTGSEIGLVSLTSDGSGLNRLSVELNVSETAQLDLAQARLPNGVMIPIIQDRQVITVPIGKGAEIYISILGDQAALGVAIPIKSFDAMGSKVGTSALMPVFSTNGVIGSAGVFTSKDAGENGFALIADVSSFVSPLIGQNLLADHSRKVMQQAQQSEPELLDVKPSRSVENKINSELYKLHKRRKTLSLH